MSENGLMTMSAVAAAFGVSPTTISDLVAKRGLHPKRMTNGKAKGLNAADRQELADVLRISPTVLEVDEHAIQEA